jgi:hypothetical protein
MSEAKPGTGATALGVIGIVLYAATGIVYLSSGLVVPAVALIVLWAVWIAGIVALVWTWRTRRSWTPLVAVGIAAFWWIYLTVGEAQFGWSA